MSKRVLCLCVAFCVSSGALMGTALGADPDMIGWWKLDEGSGEIAVDASGNGNDGTVINLTGGQGPGGAAWVEDPDRGTVLSFNGNDSSGTYVEAGRIPAIGLEDDYTWSFWGKQAGDGTGVNQTIFGNRYGGTASPLQFIKFTVTRFEFYNDDGAYTDSVTPPSPVAPDVWMHHAVVKDGASLTYYKDGVVVATSEPTKTMDENPVFIGGDAGGERWSGWLSDVRIYSIALTPEQVLSVMAGGGLSPELASGPDPEDEAGDVPRDVTLAWSPGDFAVKHNVYLGTSWEDVNNASLVDPLGTGVGQGLDVSEFAAGVLEFGQVYYWRVDEVNGAPDNTVFKGEVWSFEVEPHGRPITSITATASSSGGPGMGPEKTIDGSGLDDLDQHSITATDMWLSAPGASPWIQYDFDKVYKLDELLVWNSNQIIESFVGLGAKDVVIETSVDGAEWTVLEGAILFNQATGAATYTANTAIDFGGVLAQSVRITINAGYGPMPQRGLSEVRFLYIPTFAMEPKPVDGSTVNSANVALSWRAGREAVSSEVYLGTDAADLALLGTSTQGSFAANGLNYSTTYYWSITEVNEAEDPAAYPGDIWSFTTPDYGTVDDFDQYDDNCNRIFFAWEDGIGHSGGEEVEGCEVPPSNGNGGGSMVGNDQAPFAERTIVNVGGSTQSLPLNYDNSFGQSEATLRLSGQDWTASGVQTLAIAFYGTAGNTGTLYVKINNAKVVYDRDPADIARSGWQAWNIDLGPVNGVQNVTSLTIGVDGANAAGMLYIDDIRLYPLAGELVTPVDPGNAGLVASYSFEGNANDSSGNGHGGTVEGGASFVPGHNGNALNCDGFSGYVSTGKSASALGIDGNKARTVTCWIYTRAFNNGGLYDVGNRSGGQDFSLRTLGTESQWRVQYWGGAFDIDFTLDATDKWIHITHVYDGSATQIYADGILVAEGPGTLNTMDNNPWQIGRYGWPDAYFDGMIDELSLYNRALSAEEALFMAGRTDPVHKPF